MIAAMLVRVIDGLVQLGLIVLGGMLVWFDDDGTIIGLLAWWCVLGSAYWVACVFVVGVGVRRGPERAPRWLRTVELHPAVAILTTLATFIASFVGVVAVSEILLLRDDPAYAGWVEPVAVWAMLLSWALFHWGFARIYDRRYRREVAAEAPPPLVFPGTDSPRLVDFVYFSFTNATAFSVSDVQVMTSRMRWTVVWHTTVSFFLNALIIVLAFSTIING
ncbi:DUF1345 domain-containing protein [Microbacterium sp. HD4P20]|uniref:DUF1345 domain-containing protein n=1 Tax=Microbacterium sp. HD4P20 TaxID=2864874 RepID=UPI001C63FEF4|nr:DUF1345 domain-containing protein [Microbacterium sp. HD4P20]MCP2636449.1 DUF1345 domain-containing protein [Microbacterium sp. HD4P20]